jgi:hypothetical protein
VVSLQLILLAVLLRALFHAATSFLICCIEETRLERPWFTSTLISISDMLSQLPCLGVVCISSLFRNRLASSGGNVLYGPYPQPFSRIDTFALLHRAYSPLKNIFWIMSNNLENEIVIVNGFTKSGSLKSDSMVEKEVSRAVEAFNRGTYKVIIGSTACIGEGLNLQENSSALHHFDIPFRPSDFIQRNGRIDRQGNSQNAVALHTYMSAGTIDNYSISLV